MSHNKICLASDNWTPAHPLIIKTVVEANEGYAPAQYIPFFKNDLWKTLSTQANQQAQKIASIIKAIPHLSLSYPVETNQIFFTAPPSWLPLIQEEIFCYPWNQEKNEIRFITSWNTSDQDVKAVKSILSKIACNPT